MAMHVQASLKVEAGISLRVIRDTGGAMEKDDGAPQSEGAQPLPPYYTCQLLSRFRHSLFCPSRGMCPDTKNAPSVLPAAASTLGRAGGSHHLASIPRAHSSSHEGHRGRTGWILTDFVQL